MKKLLAILLIFSATTVSAHGPYHNNWVAPFVVGAGVGYLATRPYYPPPYYYPQPPVVIQQPPVIIQGQNCSPWTQIQNSDGSITTTRTCTQ